MWRAIVVVALLVSGCGRRPPLAPATWQAAPEHYDLHRLVTFEPDGTGELLVLDTQAPRVELPFRYTKRGDELELRYQGGRSASLRVQTERGDWRFRVELPTKPPRIVEERFACRARFSEDPFPPGSWGPAVTDYYACRVGD